MKKPPKRPKWATPWWVWPVNAVGKRTDQLSNRQLSTLSVHPALTGLGRHVRVKSDEAWRRDMLARMEEFGHAKFWRGFVELLKASMGEIYQFTGKEPSVCWDTVWPEVMQHEPLPEPTVTFELATPNMGRKVQIGNVLSIVHNPIYVGIPPFPRITDADKWVSVALFESQPDKVDGFLSNMLYCLRYAYGTPQQPGKRPPGYSTDDESRTVRRRWNGSLDIVLVDDDDPADPDITLNLDMP